MRSYIGLGLVALMPFAIPLISNGIRALSSEAYASVKLDNGNRARVCVYDDRTVVHTTSPWMFPLEIIDSDNVNGPDRTVETGFRRGNVLSVHGDVTEAERKIYNEALSKARGAFGGQR